MSDTGRVGTKERKSTAVRWTGMEGTLDRMLDELASRKDVAHAVMAVESVDGTFSWGGARGSARPDGTPMRVDTPYYIASIDKLFTAVAILKLQEQARLNVDDPIATHLGESVGGLHRLRGRDRTGEITVRHLLGHTSGLANYLEDRPKGGWSLFRSLTTVGDRSWGSGEVVRIVRDDLEPHFAPQDLASDRQRIRYSDTNYALLHAILEGVTGRPLHEVFESMLFEPLGLRATWMHGHPRPGSGGAEPANLWAGDRPIDLPAAMGSLGAVYSTVHDQVRFMRALVHGVAFEDADTFGRMQERWNRFGFPLDAAALRAPSWPIEYGLGLARFELPRVLNGFRPMPSLIGHTGSTGTWLFHCPKLDLLIAGALDQVTAGAVPFRFLPKLLREIDRPARRERSSGRT